MLDEKLKGLEVWNGKTISNGNPMVSNTKSEIREGVS